MHFPIGIKVYYDKKIVTPRINLGMNFGRQFCNQLKSNFIPFFYTEELLTVPLIYSRKVKNETLMVVYVIGSDKTT